MHGAHGVGYEVYKREHDVRMQIEEKREADYVESQRTVADISRKMHVNK